MTTGPEEDDVYPLERRIDALEEWRAAVEAVTAAKKWVVPIAVTSVVAISAAVNVILALTRK